MRILIRLIFLGIAVAAFSIVLNLNNIRIKDKAHAISTAISYISSGVHDLQQDQISEDDIAYMDVSSSEFGSRDIGPSGLGTATVNAADSRDLGKKDYGTSDFDTTYFSSSGFGSRDLGSFGISTTAAGSAEYATTSLQPPPEEGRSARRRAKRTSNTIQIAITIYPLGSTEVSSDAMEITGSAGSSEHDPYSATIAGFGHPDYEIDNTNRVFAWVKDATRIVSPYSWHMLMQYEALPPVCHSVLACGRVMEMTKPAETFHYLSGDNVFDVICRMSSNIHEISHSYSRLNMFRYARENQITLEMKDEGRLLYISPSESYLVTFPREYLFPSSRLEKTIPEDRRTLRYNTYISGNTSTQVHGVIALLDELNAYFLGSRFRYEMLEAYKIAGNTPAEGFFEWVADAQGTMGAFFEMDYFILEYLLFMKSNFPRHYDLLRSNKSFAEAWWSVRNSYSNLVAGYFQTIMHESKGINHSGEYTMGIENNRLWMNRTDSGSPSRRLIISSAMDKLLPVLKSDRFREIEKDFSVGFPAGNIYRSGIHTLHPYYGHALMD
jgi:hypothetical protein